VTLKPNGSPHGPMRYVRVRDASKALEAAQAQSAKHYRAVLRWMTYCKVKHDALALVYAYLRNDEMDRGAWLSEDQRAQVEAALNQHLEVEGEEQWLARTIMLTEALDQYLKLMEQEDADPDELQRLFLLVKERHFVFMPAELAEKADG
jgi:hypothetical protein